MLAVSRPTARMPRLRTPARSPGVQTREVQLRHRLLTELGGAEVPLAVRPISAEARAQQDDRAARDPTVTALVCLQRRASHLVVPVVERCLRHVDDHRLAHEPSEPYLVRRVAVAREVNGRVEVRSPVLGRREVVGGVEVPAFGLAFGHLLERERLGRGPVDRASVEGIRQVDQLALRRLERRPRGFALLCRRPTRPSR